MRSTFKILFYLKKNNLKPDGKAPIMGRITINGKLAQFSCKQNVKPALWDTKANKAKGKSLEAQKLNLKLDNIRSQIMKHYQIISDRDSYVTAQKVKDAYLGFGDEYKMLSTLIDEFCDDFNKRIGNDRTESSYKEYLVNCKRIKAFLKEKLNADDIPLKEVNIQFVQKFHNYLISERGLASSTSAKSVTRLRQIMAMAHRKGYISGNPLSGIKFESKFKDRGFLTEDELNLFMNIELKRVKQRQVRDIFIFCAFTGLAYADVKKLKVDDIQKSFDGDLWLSGKRKKTGSSFHVKLLPVAKQLIEQYQPVAKNEFVFPVPNSICQMNLILRRIAEKCEITKRISTHLARHSFATTVCLSQGVPIETVSKMLGHSNITTTQIYAKITNEKISNDMSTLIDKIGDKYQLNSSVG